jgi:hypothetical protein
MPHTLDPPNLPLNLIADIIHLNIESTGYIGEGT